jgi:hypothetical protein
MRDLVPVYDTRPDRLEDVFAIVVLVITVSLSAYSLINLSRFIRFQLEIWSTRTVPVSASNEPFRPPIPVTFVDPGRS